LLTLSHEFLATYYLQTPHLATKNIKDPAKPLAKPEQPTNHELLTISAQKALFLTPFAIFLHFLALSYSF